MIDRRAAVARDELIESDRINVAGVDPALRLGLACRSGCLDPAAEPYRVPDIAARRLPHVAQTQPAAGDFALPAVGADDLRKDAVVVADAISHRRILQCGQRIQEARGEPSQAAVAETGVDLL